MTAEPDAVAPASAETPPPPAASVIDLRTKMPLPIAEPIRKVPRLPHDWLVALLVLLGCGALVGLVLAYGR